MAISCQNRVVFQEKYWWGKSRKKGHSHINEFWILNQNFWYGTIVCPILVVTHQYCVRTQNSLLWQNLFYGSLILVTNPKFHWLPTLTRKISCSKPLKPYLVHFRNCQDVSLHIVGQVQTRALVICFNLFLSHLVNFTCLCWGQI